MSERLTLAQLDYPSIDVDRSVRFFTEMLGLPLLFRAGSLAFIDLGSARLYVRPVSDIAETKCASVLYLKTDNVDATIRQLESRGAEIHEAPHIVAELPDHILWMGFIRDPEGRLVGIMEERRS
ncbi:MAG TPA: VOC family protein [Caulobacteraceae bacterium]|jgi:methylmalonyl-CoA/ethylmalonyl-CoA epimerase